jgi:hypothetical protein
MTHLNPDLEYKKLDIMKKYLVSILLLLSLNSYSQVDSTKVWEARESWRSNPDNYSQGQQMPNWDLNGNIIPFVALLLGSYFFVSYKKKSQSLDY